MHNKEKYTAYSEEKINPIKNTSGHFNAGIFEIKKGNKIAHCIRYII